MSIKAERSCFHCYTTEGHCRLKVKKFLRADQPILLSKTDVICSGLPCKQYHARKGTAAPSITKQAVKPHSMSGTIPLKRAKYLEASSITRVKRHYLKSVAYRPIDSKLQETCLYNQNDD